MPTPIVVTVTFEPSTNTASIDDPLTEIGDGDSIEWRFTGLTSGHLGGIQFQAPSPSLGPFQALAYQTNSIMGNSVVGMGNTGAPGQYQYKAMVLEVEGGAPAVFSDVAIVDNNSGKKNLSPDVIVVFDQDKPSLFDPDKKSLTFTPQTLELETGRTATWHIFGVPGDHFVTFHFEEFADPLTGPFSSFFLSTAMGFQARGEGFDDSNRLMGLPGTPIHYKIRVRRADGTVVAHGHDPLIDTLGDPPPAPPAET